MTRRFTRIGSASIFLFLLAAVFGCRQDTIPAYPQQDIDKGITIMDAGAVDVDWSSDGDTIIYAKPDPADGYFDVYAVDPGGADYRCLTCGPDFPRKHNGGAAFHPSGELIVFSAENPDVTGTVADRLAMPDIGLNTNLWVMKADGTDIRRLTDIPTDYKRPRGVISPRFSQDGTILIWAEAGGDYGEAIGEQWGQWSLMAADFRIENGIPSLADVRTYRPGAVGGFYESCDVTPDDRFIILSGNLAAGQPVSGMDLAEMDFMSGDARPLIDTETDWDDHARISPDGTIIAWASSRDIPVFFPSIVGTTWTQFIRTDIWLMDTDGGNQRRITFFNDPTGDDRLWFQKNVYATDRIVIRGLSWGPGSGRMAAVLGYEGRFSSRYGHIRSVLAILDMDKRRERPAP